MEENKSFAAEFRKSHLERTGEEKADKGKADGETAEGSEAWTSGNG